MSQDVIYFKAINDQEIIARLIEETETHYTIEKARVLATQPGAKPGEITVGLVPWFVGDPDGTIDVSKGHVFARLTKAPKELEKGYLQQTSGLDLGPMG